MPQATPYDAIVIGTSRGGKFLPIAFAQAGQKVALIECDHLGGVCINVGSTPTKTMVASARVAALARRGADYGVHTGSISVDMQAVRQRKQAIVEGARSNFKNRLSAAQETTHRLDLLRATVDTVLSGAIRSAHPGSDNEHLQAVLPTARDAEQEVRP